MKLDSKMILKIAPTAITVTVMIFGAGFTYSELAQKPDREELRGTVKRVSDSLAEDHKKYDATGHRVHAVEGQMKRVQDVQEVLLLQADWQSEVLEHIARRRRGAPPEQPAELKDKRRRLMQ